MKKIGFIILHYNCYEDTKVCIDSILLLNQQEKIEILVVDNASGNDSFQKLRNEYKGLGIHFLAMKKNVGFSRANNCAFSYLRTKCDMDMVVFANNDTCFPQKDFIEKIVREYQKSNFSVLGVDVYNPKLEIHQSPISTKMARTKASMRKTIFCNKIALRFFDLYFKIFVENKPETVKQVPESELFYREGIIPVGACLIFSQNYFDTKEKIFYPETFFYYEEYILAWWCLKHDKKIIFNPDIQVYHNHGKATKSIGSQKQSAKFQMNHILKSASVYLNVLKERM